MRGFLRSVFPRQALYGPGVENLSEVLSRCFALVWASKVLVLFGVLWCAWHVALYAFTGLSEFLNVIAAFVAVLQTASMYDGGGWVYHFWWRMLHRAAVFAVWFAIARAGCQLFVSFTGDGSFVFSLAVLLLGGAVAGAIKGAGSPGVPSADAGKVEK